MNRIVKKIQSDPLALALLSLGAMAMAILLGDVSWGWFKLHYLFEIIASFYFGVWISKMKMPSILGLAFTMSPASTAMGMGAPFWIGLILVGYPFALGFFMKG